MPRYSRYVIVVDNLSSTTRSDDLEYEFKYAGKIRDLVKDSKARCALIEYDRSSDADYAWRKMNGMTLHGRTLKVEWATPSDFKFFGWKWFENSPSPSPRGRSPSRSPSRSRSRSRTPPKTPYNNDDHKGAASSSPADKEKEHDRHRD